MYEYFQTERLEMRQLSFEDIPLWEENFHNNPFQKLLGYPVDWTNHEKSHHWIKRQIERYRNNEYGLLALIEKETGKLIGQAGLLLQEVDEKKEIEIGYHIIPDQQGKGYATEAANFLKNYSISNGLTDTVICIIHIENTRSMNVAEKIGLKKTVPTLFKGLPVFIYRS